MASEMASCLMTSEPIGNRSVRVEKLDEVRPRCDLTIGPSSDHQSGALVARHNLHEVAHLTRAKQTCGQKVSQRNAQWSIKCRSWHLTIIKNKRNTMQQNLGITITNKVMTPDSSANGTVLSPDTEEHLFPAVAQTVAVTCQMKWFACEKWRKYFKVICYRNK